MCRFHAEPSPYELEMAAEEERKQKLIAAHLQKYPDAEKRWVKPHGEDWPSLLEEYGSKRRVLEAYWRDNMTPRTERFIEESMEWMQIVGFRPIGKP